jgi:hypothetical protein
VLRAVDLHQFAQAIAPPARLMRRGETMPTVLPQSIGNRQGKSTNLGRQTVITGFAAALRTLLAFVDDATIAGWWHRPA